jgi:hypothetical protein
LPNTALLIFLLKLEEKYIMATTKRTPPPKLADDLNVTAITEAKPDKTVTEPEAAATKPKATRSKKVASESASLEEKKAPAKSTRAAIPKAKPKTSELAEEPAAPIAAEITHSLAIDQEELDRRIAEAAYYLAEKREFAPGFEEEDWATAKSQVLAAFDGSSVS